MGSRIDDRTEGIGGARLRLHLHGQIAEEAGQPIFRDTGHAASVNPQVKKRTTMARSMGISVEAVAATWVRATRCQL